jgi:ubiquinone/menaquinone biosynthesis C-methylase UbiE
MNIRAAYDAWSLTYDFDANLTRDLDRRVTEHTLGHRRCHSVLEIGCGTGKNTSLLAQIGRLVTAVDFSDKMLQMARKKTAVDHVHFLLADITNPWPCTAATFDLITCNLVLEHIDNLAFIFAEADRVLLHKGHFFICELHPYRRYRGSRAVYQGEEREVEIEAFTHHVSDFLEAAAGNGFSLKRLQEWWHEADGQKPPRLMSFLFEKEGHCELFPWQIGRKLWAIETAAPVGAPACVTSKLPHACSPGSASVG